MSRNSDLVPEDLLAAYASGELDDDERQQVEQLLADNASARADLEDIQTLLDSVRAAKPTGSEEPAWDLMADDIRLHIDADNEGLIYAIRRLFRRPVVLGFAASACAALVVFFVLASERQHSADKPEIVGQIPSATTDAGVLEPALEAASDLRTANLDDLDDDEIDRLYESFAALADMASDEGDEELDDELDTIESDLYELLSEDWEETALIADSGRFDPFDANTDVDDEGLFDEESLFWLDDLDDSELDAIDAYLTEVEAG